MSSFLKNAVMAACFCIPSSSFADGLVAVITPPIPFPSSKTPDFPLNKQLPAPFKPLSIEVIEETADLIDIVARQANISNFGTACEPSMDVNVLNDAMLDVQIFAPCLPYDTVDFEHESMAFTAPLTMTGELSFTLPALSDRARLKATLSDGTTLSADVFVPDTRHFARVALQWDGKDPGTLIARVPKSLSGKVIQLGESNDRNGKILSVFSSKINNLQASGVVRLSLRAPVTLANCSVGHAARVRQIVSGVVLSSYDITMSGPGCGAVGQILELNNVLQDLKLNQN